MLGQGLGVPQTALRLPFSRPLLLQGQDVRMGLEPHAGQRDPHRRRDLSSGTERLEPLCSRVSWWHRQQGCFGRDRDSCDANPESPAVSLWDSSSRGKRGCSHRQSCHRQDTQASPGSVHRNLARPGWGRGAQRGCQAPVHRDGAV